MFRFARSLALGLVAIAAFGALSSGGETVEAQTPETVLYAVTGDGGSNPSTLYRIDPKNGVKSVIGRLGNGGDGEEIAFNPDNGLLLHASGRFIGQDKILEWVDPATLRTTNIPVSGDECDEVTGLAYAGNGTFIAGTIDLALCSISSQGVVKNLGLIDIIDVATGLAFLNGKLYATEWGNQTNLLILDPGSATVLQSIKLQVESKDYRFTALAANPCNGKLYAAMAVGMTEIRTPTPRSLVTIDPVSGRVEVIANLGESIAGLAFGPCAVPDDGKRGAAAGAIGALQAAQATSRNVAPAAPVAVVPANAVSGAPVAVSAGSVVVRPPSTGDGGLASD